MIDRILHNGKIITLNNRRSHVRAIAISHGRVLALGTDDDILKLANSNTIIDNLNGQTAIPGLTDSHLHWAWTSRSLRDVDVFEISSKQLAIERVAERAQQVPHGEWIMGQGWSQEFWEDTSFPTASDLDAVTPHHPVCLRAKSGHAVWVNTQALNLAGITATTPDPDGGQIGRDASGNPTGILFETAIQYIYNHIPDPTVDQLADMMRDAQKQALASGLVGFHDFDGPDCLEALQILREQGDLHLRALKNINDTWIDHAHHLGLRWGFGDEWIRIGGLKIFSDGALGPRTALMVEPYEGEPDNYGIRVTDKEEMLEQVVKATLRGIPSTVHAIGDLAVREVLDVYEETRKQEAKHGIVASDRRHRIEHVQLLHPDDITRLAELNIIASMQPLHATSDYEMADRYWGERNRYGYNPRLQLDQGVKVVFGSDSPIDPFEPLKTLHAAVTRRRADGSPNETGWYPEAKVTIDEALRAMTVTPAYVAGMEAQQGMLAEGYLADLVVLDRDLYTISPDDILNTVVLATMVQGEWRYQGV